MEIRCFNQEFQCVFLSRPPYLIFGKRAVAVDNSYLKLNAFASRIISMRNFRMEYVHGLKTILNDQIYFSNGLQNYIDKFRHRPWSKSHT